MNKWTGIPFSEKYHTLSEKRKNLPICRKKIDFIRTFQNNRIVLFVSPPESHRNTQIPQYILEHIDVDAGIIACNQPRRIVATARDAAEEMDVELGEHVGYVTLLEDFTRPTTILKYLSDGILLREAMEDTLLEKYQVIIMDEIDEKTLATDLLLAYLKNLLKRRSNLKLVLMGEAFEPVEKYEKYFEGAPVMDLRESKIFHDVKLVHEDPKQDIVFSYRGEAVDDHIASAILKVLEIHKSRQPGDILVFLAHENEVHFISEEVRLGTNLLLEAREIEDPIRLIPLPSILPLAVQRNNNFIPARATLNERIVYACTDVAQKVFTLDNVRFVIDCGWVTQTVWKPKDPSEPVESDGPFHECDVLCRISGASAKRRAQCCGGSQGGTCYRLYNMSDLVPEKHPEMLISDLSCVWLVLLGLGIRDAYFDFLDPPLPKTVAKALADLYHMGAIDENVHLTKLGQQIIQFPLHPKLAKRLVISPHRSEMLSICAMMSVSHLFLHPGEEQENDEDSLVQLYNAFKRKDIPQQHGTQFRTIEALTNALEAAEKLRQSLFDIMDAREEGDTENGALEVEVEVEVGWLRNIGGGCLWNCRER